MENPKQVDQEPKPKPKEEKEEKIIPTEKELENQEVTKNQTLEEQITEEIKKIDNTPFEFGVPQNLKRAIKLFSIGKKILKERKIKERVDSHNQEKLDKLFDEHEKYFQDFDVLKQDSNQKTENIFTAFQYVMDDLKTDLEKIQNKEKDLIIEKQKIEIELNELYDKKFYNLEKQKKNFLNFKKLSEKYEFSFDSYLSNVNKNDKPILEFLEDEYNKAKLEK